MPISQGYTDFILEQLGRVAPVTSRKMFGALGIYADGKIFACVDNDTLYFKVNDTNRQEYIDAGMPPFMPGGMSMGYYQVPAAVLEDGRQLAAWMRDAIAVAHTVKPKKRK
jgi:DNA transformation protein and related proteins